jgi:hypothetical protein
MRIFAVAMRPVGGESGRWVRGRRLRRLEDAVGLGWGRVDDDPLQVLVELADGDLHIIQSTFNTRLPFLIRGHNLLNVGDALIRHPALLQSSDTSRHIFARRGPLLKRAHTRLYLGIGLHKMVIPLGVEIRKSLLPPGVGLAKLVEDHLGIRVHGSLVVLESSEVVMGWVLIQIESMGNGITDSNSAEIRKLKHPQIQVSIRSME